MLKKLLLTLLAVFVVFPSVSGQVYAVSELEEQVTALEAYLTEEALSRPVHTDGVFVETQGSIFFSIMGGKPIDVVTVETSSGEETEQIVYSRGFAREMTSAIAMMYGMPAATTERYVADVLNSAGVGVVQPAYAQGLGFASLDPILETWKTFRNIAYIFFVVIFLVLGFMIMLRQKIGGQTAVTAQQAIPNVIVALLAVTFSYAIAGLLIDAMYLLMYFMISIFGANQSLISYGFLALGKAMIVSGADSGMEITSNFARSLGQTWDGVLGDISGTATWLGQITVAVIIAVAIALNVFKLFFELIKIYVTIILTIAFAPVFLMLGAIPGRNEFMNWIKTLVGNMAVFPTILLVLIVYEKLTETSLGQNIIGSTSAASDFTSGGFLPPYIFGSGEGLGSFFPFLVGLGMLLILPDLVKKVKESIAPAGIFDQLVQNVGESVKRGWEGGELIEGLGFTDTNNLPFIGRYGGLSGKNTFNKQTEGLGGVISGGVAAARSPRDFLGEFRSGFVGGSSRVSRFIGDKKGMFPKKEKELADDEKRRLEAQEQAGGSHS